MSAMRDIWTNIARRTPAPPSSDGAGAPAGPQGSALAAQIRAAIATEKTKPEFPSGVSP